MKNNILIIILIIGITGLVGYVVQDFLSERADAKEQETAQLFFNQGVEQAVRTFYQQSDDCQPVQIRIANDTKTLIDVACLEVQEE